MHASNPATNVGRTRNRYGSRRAAPGSWRQYSNANFDSSGRARAALVALTALVTAHAAHGLRAVRSASRTTGDRAAAIGEGYHVEVERQALEPDAVRHHLERAVRAASAATSTSPTISASSGRASRTCGSCCGPARRSLPRPVHADRLHGRDDTHAQHRLQRASCSRSACRCSPSSTGKSGASATSTTSSTRRGASSACCSRRG